jgi:hypothetical protein
MPPCGRRRTRIEIMITSLELRQFSRDCIRWAKAADNPSDRDIMIGVALRWMQTACAIERRLSDGTKLTDDLRRKLD